ncbi:hypothetical protein TARUN_424 [Trichoderma arundinaceum]|uniref:Uncharacterized protein n=1 Tax=Trichoderma arundinaceum TaxID=490622 RepID=A0A395P092_TRIAR|nr:hypothetical protein TARUN_424 [Trichoderma arundinaceum]
MKDSECGAVPEQKKMTTFRKVKKHLLEVKVLASTAIAVCMLAAILAISLLAAHCAGLEKWYQSHGGFTVTVEKVVDQKLDRRGVDCHETDLVMSGSSADAVTFGLNGDGAAMVSVTSIPISTQTATSTIYSIITPSEPAIMTKTMTMTTSVLLTSETPMCSAVNATVTVTVTVVPTPSTWASSSVLGDITVTADASTVTNINTDVSYTSGLPDATVPGSPSTVTNVDVSVTGLPDVTISGKPSTVTNLLTDVSLTSGLPDATISGNPSTVTAIQTSFSLTAEPITSFVTVVISDLWGSSTNSSIPELVTVTAVSTIKTTVTTINSAPSPVIVTVTNAYSEPVKSTSVASADSSKAGAQTSRQSTRTETVTATSGQLFTTTTTVFLPPVFSSLNGTEGGIPTGTATSVIMPSIPVVVSGSNKGLEPRRRTLCGLIMMITVIISML